MLVRTLAVFLTVPAVAQGFAFSFMAKPAPGLKEYAKAQTGTHLDIRLDIGKEKDEYHMIIDGLGIDLSMDPMTDKKNRVKMPGANGPNPNLSSGIHNLHVTDKPSYIDMDGIQKVDLLNGCWEMTWREGAPAGGIVCGFNVPKEAKRNGVSLPSGRIWLAFPIWTKDNLAEYQVKKHNAEVKAQEFLDEKNNELVKMQGTSNILMKALHYRNAIKAMEGYDLTAIRFYQEVPEDEDTLAIGEGLFLTTKGTIWTKERGTFGEEHVLLGSAIVRQDAEEKKSVLAP